MISYINVLVLKLLQAMPVLIFFSAIINVLYHYGIVQYFILKVSWLINFIMGTSPTESITATANIFLGIQFEIVKIISIINY
jgi:nucleoside permease NupC